MRMTDLRKLRLGLLAELVCRAPERLGRTAVMKLIYILQAVYRIPLGYEFKLYTYGPFDAQVLDDLAYSERLGVIESSIVEYAGGSGYILRPGSHASEVRQSAASELSRFQDDIERVMRDFSWRKAVDLEMIGTILFVAEAARRKKGSMNMEDIAKRVHAIKPHLSEQAIRSEAERLREQGLLPVTA